MALHLRYEVDVWVEVDPDAVDVVSVVVDDQTLATAADVVDASHGAVPESRKARARAIGGLDRLAELGLRATTPLMGAVVGTSSPGAGRVQLRFRFATATHTATFGDVEAKARSVTKQQDALEREPEPAAGVHGVADRAAAGLHLQENAEAVVYRPCRSSAHSSTMRRCPPEPR